MPFVQRVVTPTYISRSHGNGRTRGGPTNSNQTTTINTNHAPSSSVTLTKGIKSPTSASSNSSTGTIIAINNAKSALTKAKQHTCKNNNHESSTVKNLDGKSKQNDDHHHDHENCTKTTSTCCSTVTNINCCNGIENEQVGLHSINSISYATDAEADADADANEAEVKEGFISNNTRSGCVDGNNVCLNDDDEDDDVGGSGNVCGNLTTKNQQNHSSSTGESTSSPTSRIVTGYELESISNITLSNALRQLASLVIIANDIFVELNKELQNVSNRSRIIKTKFDSLQQRVDSFDPKLVTVPESDLGTFAQRKTHYHADKKIEESLFTTETRPRSVKILYEEAAKTPVDRFNAIIDDTQVDRTGTIEYVCTPVFGKANRKMRKKIDAEIEIRLPAGIDDLRRWTSSEALGDVTVTPDCINRVDTSITTSINIGDNGFLVAAFSPSILSADAVDAFYSVNTSNDNSQIPNETNTDVPLNHRLPSPEEQCQMIALKYPAEIISVDTSGRRFERMCLARKSTIGFVNIGDENNLNEDVQTVSRRSRSRKVRGKRRNTIAGIDQKEIEDAANGESELPAKIKNENIEEIDIANRFGRSQSSDILKNESAALQFDKGKPQTLKRLNSLKQWGRNRFKFITRHDGDNNNKQKSNATSSVVTYDIDDECQIQNIVAAAKSKNEFFEKENRFSHERKPSYSSSEKSVSIVPNKLTKNCTVLASNVKLRDTSSLNRQRRNGFAGHKEEPHSSSGNWSASSESGRASIGSEITIQPKSSASNTSLNNSSFHPGSGPPSSIISRRKFFNTSASSSVTSEGTATPDLQVNEIYVDDETSSAYSCDTEGYYTSFHMDSGLRTLKEEEPMTPLHVSSVHPSNYSFGSISNQTVLSAENEYELFGRGSTSTTTSSAGTVITALLAGENAPDVPERISSLTKLHSSNSTLERSYSSSTVGSTLERTGTIKRNYSAAKREVAVVVHEENNSVNLHDPDTPESMEVDFNFDQKINERPPQLLPVAAPTSECSESSDFEGVERIERIKQKTVLNSKRIPSMCIITPTTSDDENGKDNFANPETFAKSEIDDIPYVDISQLMHSQAQLTTLATQSTNNSNIKLNITSVPGYATVEHLDKESKTNNSTTTLHQPNKDINLNNLKRSLHPLNNMFDRLKVVLPNMKKSSNKDINTVSQEIDKAPLATEEDIYDVAGEYVTIADISNNNNNNKNPGTQLGNLGIYYSNDIVRQNLATVLSGNLKRETEYVSLNELPCNIRAGRSNIDGYKSENKLPFASDQILSNTTTNSETESFNKSCAIGTSTSFAGGTHNITTDGNNSGTEKSQLSPPHQPLTTNRGARVKMNAQGKIIYDSDSLKRRKGAHTTFAPGPYVKETESALLSANLDITITNDEPSPPSPPPLPQPIASETSESSTIPKSVELTKTQSKSSFISGGCANRKLGYIRPVISQNRIKNQNQIENQNPTIVNVTTKSDMYNYETPYSTSTSRNSSPASPSFRSSPVLNINNNNNNNPTKAVFDEGYQHFYNPGLIIPSNVQQTSLPIKKPLPAANNTNPFSRNAPMYWTLQNRKSVKPIEASSSSRDDLYATPISRLNRTATVNNSTSPLLQNKVNISPIVPRNKAGFLTSTPTKTTNSVDVMGSPSRLARQIPMCSNNEKTGDRQNTCSDRIGTAKTSLMDFKKLLLAKSTKTNPTQKLSAVELLKANKMKEAAAASAAAKCTGTQNVKSNSQQQVLNSSMTLLDLSGSPKVFANRRMLRQGQFGSPSKSFMPKHKSAVWRMNATRTDVMSKTILEANSEDDHSSTTGSSSSGSKTNSEAGDSVIERNVSEEAIDIKKNIFLQAEENNFMKGELKAQFFKSQLTGINKFEKPEIKTNSTESTKYSRNFNYYGATNTNKIDENQKILTNIYNDATKQEATNSAVPALETAL